MIRYSIGELASEFNLTNRTLRFWEEADLVSPIRRGQSRIYTEADRNWVRTIAAWSAAGLTLREIKAMRDMPVADRRAFLLKRLPAIQSNIDEQYARRCRAIEQVMAMISEHPASRLKGVCADGSDRAESQLTETSGPAAIGAVLPAWR